MYSFVKSKPRPVFHFKPEETGNIYLHKYESEDAFNRAVQLQNFLVEMMKFFPQHMREGYQCGTEKTFEMEGIGEWGEDFTEEARHTVEGYDHQIFTRGHYARWRLENGFAERYGDMHNNWINDNYWGYGGGKYAANLNYYSSAAENNNFDDLDPEGFDNPLDLAEYLSVVYDGYGASAPGLSSINSSEFAAAQEYLNTYFEGKSFYEIAMTGIANSDLGYATTNYWTGTQYEDVKVLDWNNIYHDGGFLYDGAELEDGKGAYYLMLYMLEKTRRVNYGMSYMFGSAFNIIDNDYMLDHFNSVLEDEDKLGGVSTYNLRPLESFFGAQHAWHSMMGVLRGGYNPYDGTYWSPAGGSLDHPDGKDPGGFSDGNMYSARDLAGFQRFRHWLYENVTEYRDSLSDGSKVQNLLDEWTGKIEGPYTGKQAQWSSDELSESLKAGYRTNPGWSYFSLMWDNDTSPYYYNSDSDKSAPPGATPFDMDNCHREYSSHQMLDLDYYTLIGEKDYNGRNMFETNWVVQKGGSFARWRKDGLRSVVTAMTLNSMEIRRKKRDDREYKEWKTERKEEIAQQKRDQAKLDSKRSAAKNDIKKADNKKHQNNNETKKQNNKAKPAAENKNNITMKEAISKLALQAYKRSRGKAQEKNKKSEAARKSE